MPNRGAGGVSYRYGFNGKETENDVKGIGNEQDYGMRIYDPRLGRFLSVDPIANEYPWYTPYQFAGNNPINFLDVDGLEPPTKTAAATPASSKPKVEVKIDEDVLNGRSGGSRVRNPVRPKAPTRTSGGSLISAVIEAYQAWQFYKEASQIADEQERQYRRFLLGNPTNKLSRNQILASLEQHTTDPSTLSNEYLAEVAQRIKDGVATLQDYLYQDEIEKRKKAGNLQDDSNGSRKRETYTKLSDKEIEILQERFGDGDPDFIEKVKKPGGKGAGKVDLYKNDKTGEIVVIPKAQKDKSQGGETTGYNTKDLKNNE